MTKQILPTKKELDKMDIAFQTQIVPWLRAGSDPDGLEVAEVWIQYVSKKNKILMSNKSKIKEIYIKPEEPPKKKKSIWEIYFGK